jgi:predicted ABC-type ATPase
VDRGRAERLGQEHDLHGFVSAGTGRVDLDHQSGRTLKAYLRSGRPALVPDANLEAVKRIETWLYASVRAHQTVGVETVLSTDKYQKLVSFAHERGFGVRLVYVYLKTPDINVDRVAARVSKGGHDVPEDKIRSRWTRSFKQLAWFLANADRTDIFDNSEAEPRLVLSRQGPELEVYGKLIPEIEAALRQAFPALVRIADQEK